MKLHVPDMSCGHCTAAIDKAVKAIDPDARIETDLSSKTVSIASSKDPAKVKAAVEEAGYPATPT